ncbi:kinase-like domain-containing protein [Chaetomidium leptoderma]|uniref:Kinase-like domain-containing protein n=1 Tax=Chaetomidium leptoderma TaxID=669021 RepID=A0AAN6VHU1_9PEZI|nr:kinase-like domain-containing protein [Chaetomidium leptoderma]
MGRVCADCARDLPQTSYTSNQWSKGLGLSRCAGCVHGHPSDTPATQQSDSGRYNDSVNATVSYDALNNPFASGAFRWVAKGVYTSGARSGQACVLKWFKMDAAVDRALEIVNRFNELNIINKIVKINVPSVWMFDKTASRAGQKALVEPFIQNYQKFNSNTGWKDDWGAWPQAMQALSHFSYHVSGGNNVLCDLQGGIYQHKVVLSDPAILSRTGDYGVTDLGRDGISSFFSEHDCNQYCRPNWTKPANPRLHFNPVLGTTMLCRTVPTSTSWPSDTCEYRNW